MREALFSTPYPGALALGPWGLDLHPDSTKGEQNVPSVHLARRLGTLNRNEFLRLGSRLQLAPS